jgi:hypothetical protein
MVADRRHVQNDLWSGFVQYASGLVWSSLGQAIRLSIVYYNTVHAQMISLVRRNGNVVVVLYYACVAINHAHVRHLSRASHALWANLNTKTVSSIHY